jgi:DNA-binding GntR family transcriptional regulator
MLPNRTARIPLMTRDRLRDVSTARVALEGLTTERAASMLSMAEVGRLQALDRQMKRVAKDADARTYLQLNQEFHFLIYEAAKSPVLLSLIERLWLQAGPFIAQTFTREGVNAGLEKHAIVVDALKSRDAAAARRAIESDIREAADLLLASHNFPDSVLTNAGEGH